MQSRGFSTGITWWYWPYFALKGDGERTDTFTETAMYIPSGKHSNFKEEILEYRTMTSRAYRNLEIKVQRYMVDSTRVKEMKAHPTGWCRFYGIDDDEPVGADHLRAICLYCDYTKLSAEFAEAFRQMDPEEDTEDVKKRNTIFWWMSKYLREAVEVYGSDGSSRKYKKYWTRGPFYSGVSFVAVVPSFYISLKGPTSMTKLFEVSTFFSGDNGIILKLNNDREPGKYTNLFDTQWISNYMEEVEHLVFAGAEPLQLQSVKIISTAHDFESIIWPLHWFDFFLSENWIGQLIDDRRKQRKRGQDNGERGKWLTPNNIQVLLDLMEYAETKDAEHAHFPQYVLDIFDHWRFNKKRLVIAPWKFDHRDAKFPPALLNMIFHSLSNDAIPSDDNFEVNLVTQRVLNIFPELESMEIRDSANYQFCLPLFMDMLRGLKSVHMGTLRECTVKAKWIPLDFEWQSDLNCGLTVTVTKNMCGFSVLTITMHTEECNIETVYEGTKDSDLELEIEDVD